MTFDQLVAAVRQTLVEGKRRIEWAAVFADWETGRLINVHYRHNETRAPYAETVIPRLAQRTGIHPRSLYYCAQFHRLIPLVNRCSQLTSGHYRMLCQVEDPRLRQEL